MIPDNISQAVLRIQGGQASQQDIQMVESWYAANQGNVDTQTSAAISSALSRGKAIASSSQIGLGNQYTQPGTPAGLPPSSGPPITPNWQSAPPIGGGIPATDVNLEAAANAGFQPPIQGSRNSNFPGQSGTWERGVDTYGSNYTADEEAYKKMLFENMPHTPGGAGLVANSTSGESFSPDNVDVISYYQDMTKGTPLEGLTPMGIDALVNNPDVYANLLSEKGGGGGNTTAFLGPRAEAALKLAGMGLLGHGTLGAPGHGIPGQNLTSGPATDVEKLLAAQAFMDQFNQPGAQFVDVAKLFNDSFNRAMNTDFNGMTDQNGRPLTTEAIIQKTNEALFAAAPFMSAEEQSALSSVLDYAALQYMTEIATGNISMSYPAYLKSLGVDQMLSGVS